MDTKTLRQKILDIAIRGKLVPQDPNDEPASVLLDRISAEKERLIKEGKIKRSKKNASADKPHYENMPFELPKGWTWCTLDDLAVYKKGPFGSSLTKAMFVPESKNAFKVYEQKNAINKDENLGSYYISAEKFESLKGFEVQPEDIIVSCAGTIGETYVLPHGIRRGIINQALMYVRLINHDISDFYLLYFDFVLKHQAAKESKGTAIKNIPPFDVLKSFEFPLPPLSEQKRIIKRINYILSFVDNIEEEKIGIEFLLDSYKSKILDLAIHGKLVDQDDNDEPAIELLKRLNSDFTPADTSHYENLPFIIPDNWVWERFGEISKWQSGATPSRNNKLYYGGDIPWLKTGDLNDGYVEYIPETITAKALQETSVKLTPADSVLLAMYGATIGKVGILKFPATTNQACCACIKHEGITTKYLFYFLLSHKEQFIEQGMGGAQPNISKEKIIETYIPIPPLKEQDRIVLKIETIFKALDFINNTIADEV